jgi:hypothetical protein
MVYAQTTAASAQEKARYYDDEQEQEEARDPARRVSIEEGIVPVFTVETVRIRK